MKVHKSELKVGDVVKNVWKIRECSKKHKHKGVISYVSPLEYISFKDGHERCFTKYNTFYKDKHYVWRDNKWVRVSFKEKKECKYRVVSQGTEPNHFEVGEIVIKTGHKIGEYDVFTNGKFDQYLSPCAVELIK